MVECIRLDRICAEACAALNQILIVKGAEFTSLVQYCKEICRKCANECKKHEAQHCKDCAKACEECESACEVFLV